MNDRRAALIIALIANVGAAIHWLTRPAPDVLAEIVLAAAWALAGVTFVAWARRSSRQGTAATPLRYAGIFLILAAVVVVGRLLVLRSA